jgi:hypothetical protein
MRDEDKADLFRLVLERLDNGRRGAVSQSIYDAHNGRPDGLLVTTDNMWLFRQYRNSVSPSPGHMIDAALAYQKEKSHDLA